MITVQEFLLRCRVEHRSLEAWIAAGWLIPPQTEPELMFNDVDEGVSVILHLIDQMHGLRRSMQDLLDELHSRGATSR
jgi:chaperone modulatory protein CbpM